MNDAIREIRNQVRTHTRSRPATSVRYPAAVREAAVALARERTREGRSISRTAKELGLRPRTLWLWMRQGRAPRLRPVAVVTAPRDAGATRAVLVTPQGFRVEGLDAAGLAVLLRELS